MLPELNSKDIRTLEDILEGKEKLKRPLVYKLLRRLGFEEVNGKGSHVFFVHPNIRQKVRNRIYGVEGRNKPLWGYELTDTRAAIKELLEKEYE